MGWGEWTRHTGCGRKVAAARSLSFSGGMQHVWENISGHFRWLLTLTGSEKCHRVLTGEFGEKSKEQRRDVAASPPGIVTVVL